MSAISGGMVGNAGFTQVPTSGFFSGVPIAIPSVRLQQQVTPGTGADQLDGLSPILLNLAASTPQVIDLLSLVDFAGNALTVARVSFIAVKIITGSDGAVVQLDGTASNGFTGLASGGAAVKVYPGTAKNDGFTVFSAPGATGMPVSSSNHLISVNPQSTAQTVLIVIGTRSA